MNFINKYQGLGKGTGFLIASDLILTVANNVYDRKADDCNFKNGEVHIYPGVSGPLSKPFKVLDYRFPEAFKTCSEKEKRKYDYALLKIDGKIERSKYFSLGVNFTSSQ